MVATEAVSSDDEVDGDQDLFSLVGCMDDKELMAAVDEGIAAALCSAGSSRAHTAAASFIQSVHTPAAPTAVATACDGAFADSRSCPVRSPGGSQMTEHAGLPRSGGGGATGGLSGSLGGPAVQTEVNPVSPLPAASQPAIPFQAPPSATSESEVMCDRAEREAKSRERMAAAEFMFDDLGQYDEACQDAAMFEARQAAPLRPLLRKKGRGPADVQPWQLPERSSSLPQRSGSPPTPSVDGSHNPSPTHTDTSCDQAIARALASSVPVHTTNPPLAPISKRSADRTPPGAPSLRPAGPPKRVRPAQARLLEAAPPANAFTVLSCEDAMEMASPSPAANVASAKAGTAPPPTIASANGGSVLPSSSGDEPMSTDGMSCESPKAVRAAAAATAAATTTASVSPPGTGQRARSRVEELEAELGEANVLRRQLEAALAAAAEEVQTTRARFEELLPMGLDEEPPLNSEGTAALNPADEPTVISGDESEGEEAPPPQLTSAQQWNQLWGQAKAKAKAAEVAAKAAAKAKAKPSNPATDWSLEDFRRVETATKNRRAVPVTSAAPAGRSFDNGQKGPIKHPRQGLAGAVQFWARGSRHNVVILLMKLIRYFGVEASIREQLGRKESRDAQTNSYMVARARDFVQASKSCATVEQHRQYLFGLGIFAPPHGESRDQESMGNRVAAALGVTPGCRSDGRPRAFFRAQDLRAAFDARLADLYVPMQQVGEEVLCRGQLARLTSYDSMTGRCEVTFSYEGAETTVSYASRYGHSPGSARLQRPPALLLPPPRERIKGRITAETCNRVREIFELTCATSPHQKDQRKRRLGRHVFQTLQAMIQTLPLDEIYRIFQKTYPLDKLGWTQFRSLKPWNLIKAYRETCLCRCCELFRLFVMALQVVAKLLEPLVTKAGHMDDAEGADAEVETANNEVEATDADLAWLVSFCKAETKSDMANMLVCGGCLETAKPVCINGKCQCCGFAKRWSRGLRPRLVNSDKRSPDLGKLLDGVPPVWEHEVRYEVLKSSGSTPSDGSNEDNNTLRAQRVASVVQFLDAFEEASVKFPAHRHLVGDTKVKAKRRDRYFWPGMLLSDYDWSENGVIANARQIQSEYWALTHFSLFISITTYLVVEAWLHRSSLLSVGAEVTVEPEGAVLSTAERLSPAKGSFYAVVHGTPAAEGEREIYSVTVYDHPSKADGTVIAGIPRERLRHRKKHTTAFIGITDEKRHDAITSQHMLNKQFEHWVLQLDRGKFWAWLGHSDNASHFKSGPMMHYWSGKMSELAFLKAVWIDFGCPGHGKGPWDGMGAVMKQQLTRDLTNGQILTQSGYVRDPREVAEQLRKRFQTDEWIAAHVNKAIHEIVVTYSQHNEITERPTVEHEFTPLTGKMSSFSYMALARDQIARRERSCFCEGCFHQLGRATLRSSGYATLVCDECESDKAYAALGMSERERPSTWHEQEAKDLGTGLAGRRMEAQAQGHKYATMLKPFGFMAIQARERWSTTEEVYLRPGYCWYAQASDVLDVRKITKRETIAGQPYHPGDYCIRIGRYFDRDPADTSGQIFEEWQPELVFTEADKGEKLSISASGHVKVGRQTREVYWGDKNNGDEQPATISGVTITSVTDEWVRYGSGRNDRFRNPRVAGGFVINSSELRGVNFSMEVLEPLALQPRSSGRLAALVKAPLPKRYRLPKELDDEHRARCW